LKNASLRGTIARIKAEVGVSTDGERTWPARKYIDTGPRLLPVDLAQQLLPETFEHALNHLLEHEIDLSGFDARFCNDETGATAYPPAMLWKVVLFAYSRGVFGNLRYNKGLDRFTLCGKGNSVPQQNLWVSWGSGSCPSL